LANEDFISTTNIDINEIWTNILDEVAKNISMISFDVWIKSLEVVDIKENILVLSTPTKSSKDILVKKYKTKLISAANTVYSAITDVEFVIKTDIVAEPAESDEKTPITKERVYVDENNKGSFNVNENAFHFNSKYTFDSFIVGGSNQFAAAAAKAVAEEPSTKINPLFIYGGSGLGKTHLLHAIGNYLQEHSPKLNVIYVTTDKFITDFTNSIQKHSTDKFRETYSKADVLIIDDIQAIIKKEQTQEQFFNIFNELYQNGKRLPFLYFL
jgi:chromosomal replication initiator protein